jgi:hypothetical protein
MRKPREPRVTLYTSVSEATDELRRRLEARTGFTLTRLVTEASAALREAPPEPHFPETKQAGSAIRGVP